MEPRHPRLKPEHLTQILRKMVRENRSDQEITRLVDLWKQSDRVMTIFTWLARPVDDVDKDLNEFLRACLLVDD